jgi:hypothetical protein
MTLGCKLFAALLILSSGAIPGQNTFAQSRVALHATQEEIDIWKQRRINGPYLDDWTRILARANSFKANPSGTWNGNTMNSCWSGGVPGRAIAEPIRDAAFVYMLTNDVSYSTPVRTKLLEQVAITGTDFSNRTKWCTDMDIAGTGFEIGIWLRKLTYAYDYIKPSLNARDKANIEAWLLNAGEYFSLVIDNRIKRCFPNRASNNYGISCGSANKNFTHHNGYITQNHMGVFANKETLWSSAMAAIAVVLNDQTLIDASVKYAKEWLRFAVFPDGTVYDQHRWINLQSSPGNPGSGYGYATTAIGSMMSIVDHLQRRGQSLYEYTTSEGAGNTVGGPKSFGLVVERIAQMQQHLIDVYGSEDGTLTECERIDDFLDRAASGCTQFSTSHRIVNDMAPMAQTNVFYKNNTVAAAYSRTPHSSPTSGGYDAFGGDWGNYPGARFMFGQMEGKVWPYTTASSSSPHAPTELTVDAR